MAKTHENLAVTNIISKYQDKMFEEFDNLVEQGVPVREILDDQYEHDLLEAYDNWLEDGV